MSESQRNAFKTLWSCYGLALTDGLIDYQKIFSRQSPCFLEIGFGSGQSLLALAKQHLDKNFIGVETHKPGIGALLLGMQMAGIDNIRIYDGDVVDVLTKCIPPASLAGVQIFFPDPWPKRRHHKRRLIQPEFVSLIVEKLQNQATLHLATDWQDYAVHMMKVLSQETALINGAGLSQFAGRSPYRPIITKFEQRGEREGRKICELQFIKHATEK